MLKEVFSPGSLLQIFLLAYGIVGFSVAVYVRIASIRLIRRSSEAFGLWAVLSTPFLFPILLLVVVPLWPLVLWYYTSMRDELESIDKDQ